MKKLGKFVAEISERKNEDAWDNIPSNPKDKNLNPDRMKGKSAEKNGSKGRWAIDEPTDDDILNDVAPEDLNKNIKKLKQKFETRKPFFIQGQAGWGKTSIIKQQAKHYGRTIITVYLDKCEATDLGGLPYVRQGAKGKGVSDYAMPGWADYIMEHEETPNKKFLLFFDEMNQAQPDVMNALMPIILENSICGYQFDKDFLMIGAAGNMEEENRAGVNKLSKPLKDRFRPIIEWECDWNAAKKHLHSKYDEKLGKDIIDAVMECAEIFSSPRTIERGILEYLQDLKAYGDYQKYDVDDYYDQIIGCIDDNYADDLSRPQEASLQKLAEKMYNWMNDVEDKKNSSNGRKKDENMVPEGLRETVLKAIKDGYIPQKENGKIVKYGVSRENYLVLMEVDDDNILTPEILNRLVAKLEAEDVKFRFEKNAEWKKAGYKDPLEGE